MFCECGMDPALVYEWGGDYMPHIKRWLKHNDLPSVKECMKAFQPTRRKRIDSRLVEYGLFVPIVLLGLYALYQDTVHPI